MAHKSIQKQRKETFCFHYLQSLLMPYLSLPMGCALADIASMEMYTCLLRNRRAAQTDRQWSAKGPPPWGVLSCVLHSSFLASLWRAWEQICVGWINLCSSVYPFALHWRLCKCFLAYFGQLNCPMMGKVGICSTGGPVRRVQSLSPESAIQLACSCSLNPPRCSACPRTNFKLGKEVSALLGLCSCYWDETPCSCWEYDMPTYMSLCTSAFQPCSSLRLLKPIRHLPAVTQPLPLSATCLAVS